MDLLKVVLRHTVAMVCVCTHAHVYIYALNTLKMGNLSNYSDSSGRA